MKYFYIIFLITALLLPVMAYAHCDTMEGPVVKDARIALERGDVTPVLKWIQSEYEKQITDLFKKTLLVGAMSSEAEELSEMYFFKTLARLHRAGEGEAYTGLKSISVEPIVALSDQSRSAEKIDDLIMDLNKDTANKINDLFRNVLEKKKQADKSVEAGREYVEAYITFMHFIENIHQLVMGSEMADHH